MVIPDGDLSSRSCSYESQLGCDEADPAEEEHLLSFDRRVEGLWAVLIPQVCVDWVMDLAFAS